MIKFNASTLLYKRQFLYLAGVSPDIFVSMTDRLRPSWERLCRRKNRAERPYGAGGLEDHVLIFRQKNATVWIKTYKEIVFTDNYSSGMAHCL